MTKTNVRVSGKRPVNPILSFVPTHVDRHNRGPLPAESDLILAEAAHDLNNALSVIRLQLDLLALDLAESNHSASDRVWMRLRLIQTAVRHASDVTRQFTSSNALTSMKITGSPRPLTALNPVLERMVPILSAMLPSRVDLRLRLGDDLDDVAIDPVEVVRIVSNLVLNSCAALARAAASKASGEHQVAIETSNWPAGGVTLRVLDTGVGLSPSARANLFRPLFTTKPRQKHAGLGLASVQRMVRNAGGQIHVESVAGEGTDVQIRFPSTNARTVAPRKQGSLQTGSSRRAQPVLPDRIAVPNLLRIRKQG